MRLRHGCADRSLVLTILLPLLVAGCSHSSRSPWFWKWSRRDLQRSDADIDSYAIIGERRVGSPWDPPVEFSIQPDPRSRLYDGSDPDDPALPSPGPNLYSYTIPELSPRAMPLPLPAPMGVSPENAEETTSSRKLLDAQEVVPASFQQPPGDADGDDSGSNQVAQPDDYGNDASGGLRIQPIPKEYWESVPPQCLSRMLEFETVRVEYRRTFGVDPPDSMRDASRKLTLEDIIELGQINSRDYQTQKESLYRSALALTLERFDYATKFSAGANGVDLNGTHARGGGATSNGLSVPSTLRGDRMLATGGTILGQFANDVVLTLNGPDGFAADVGSEMLFRLTQSLIQRDVLLNPLIQSERNVVYSARTYARFRKQFFFNLASDYYNLLNTYRRIEINTQNYFSLVRNFEQAQAEVRSGIQAAPNQVNVDQFEQSMLGGRSTLITTCNGIEQAFDSLKLEIGLPTETPINLDLTELEQLTLRDAVEVAGERVRRWAGRLELQRIKQPPDRGEVLNASVFLIERTLEWMELRQQMQDETPSVKGLEDLYSRLRVEQARLRASRERAELRLALDSVPPQTPISIYGQTRQLIDALLVLLQRQIDRAERLQADRAQIDAAAERLRDFIRRFDELQDRLLTNLQQAREGKIRTLTPVIESLREDSADLLTDVETFAQATDRLIGVPEEPLPEAEQLQETIDDADGLLTNSRQLLQEAGLGLPQMEISVDQAMATSLVQRLDLMNERGFLADDWRTIKLRGDDLKSILNLDASQSIRTRDNQPFDFNFDNSTTRLNLSLDLPFNRMAQRNAYRNALINFQVGRRGLMEFEDRVIKFGIRNEMRDLELARTQYPISVTQAALAAEQVISIQLSLAFSVPNVRVPDLLDALDDSRNALVNVANARIGYIVQRARFALDLELMQLDDNGFWPEIYNEDYQPVPRLEYPFGAGPAYGGLPGFLKISDELRRMQYYGRPGWQESIEVPSGMQPDADPALPGLQPMLPEPQPVDPPDVTDLGSGRPHFTPVRTAVAVPAGIDVAPDSLPAETGSEWRPTGRR